MPAEDDAIIWAVHGDSQNPGRFELGFKNLTKEEAHAFLTTLNRMQLYRAAGVNPTEMGE